MNVPLHPSMKNVGGGHKNVKKIAKNFKFFGPQRENGKSFNRETYALMLLAIICINHSDFALMGLRESAQM